MAARRERERRRPTAERRYSFGATQPDIAPEEAALEAELEQEDAVDGAVAAPGTPGARTASRSVVATRAARPAPPAKPFTAYSSEYAYVIGDLRRIVLVVGILLAALVVLYLILPH
jgi:hypothetical protein